MSKVAFLVDYSIMTRVVVDIPNDVNVGDINENDEIWAKIAQAANEKMKKDMSVFCCDNIIEINEDTECPFGTFTSDN
jgi:hypothetical protein